MKSHFIIILIVLVSIHFSLKGQIIAKTQLGASYIEHVSTGISFEFSDKRAVTLLFGSNLFVNPHRFSSYMIQYERHFTKLIFWNIIPKVGIKGGSSVYTDEYYRWKLTEIVPFIGFGHHINKRFEAFLDLGLVYSREESLRRVKYGAIGSYKSYLPELKIGLTYSLNKGK